MADTTATDTDGQWVTYAELAKLRGISPKAAARLTLRHGWRRQPGNDGATRVFGPHDMTRRQVSRTDGPSSPLSETKAVAEANRRADEANHRADAALALADRLSDRADRLERDLAAALAVADEARTAARKAEDAAEALRQADEARKAKGRLRRAWDGLRGR